LCLQELDLYDECVAALSDFESCHSKVDLRTDRCAIFWRKELFQLVESQVVEFDDLAEVIDEENADNEGTTENVDNKQRKVTQQQTSRTGKPTVSALSGMVQSFLRRNTAVIAVLQHSKTRQKFAITSAHLYWNPGYEYVKLAQAILLLKMLHQLAMRHSPPSNASSNEIQRDEMANRIPVFVCGDLNSTPGSAVHTFASRGKIDARNVAPWRCNSNDDEEEAKDAYASYTYHSDGGEAVVGGYFTGNKLPLNEYTKEKIIALSLKLYDEKLICEEYDEKPMVRQVKYMLDFTLNRFTRWLRILGLDAALETEQEEKERTRSSTKHM